MATRKPNKNGRTQTRPVHLADGPISNVPRCPIHFREMVPMELEAEHTATFGDRARRLKRAQKAMAAFHRFRCTVPACPYVAAVEIEKLPSKPRDVFPLPGMVAHSASYTEKRKSARRRG